MLSALINRLSLTSDSGLIPTDTQGGQWVGKSNQSLYSLENYTLVELIHLFVSWSLWMNKPEYNTDKENKLTWIFAAIYRL